MAYPERYSNDRQTSRVNGPNIEELATAILTPRYDIDFNNPPAVPSLEIPVELDAAYPFICATVASELTKSAEVTPAHTFLYNITAPGNFDSQEFDDIVKVAVSCIDGVMRSTDPAPDLNAVVRDVSRDVVDGVAALTATSSREMGAILRDADWRILDEATRVYNDLKQLAQPPARRGYSAGSRQSYTSTSRGSVGRPVGRASASVPRGDTSRREERPVRRDERLTANEAARRAVGGNRAQAAAPAQEVAAIVRQADPMIVVPAHWRSSSKQPYRPAYNVVSKEEILQATPEGIISVNKPRETIMEDYNSHTTKMGARAVYTDQKLRNQHVEGVLREAEAAAVTESIALNAENLPAFYAADGLFVSRLMLDYTIKSSNGNRPSGATSHGGVTYSRVLTNSGNGNAAETYAWLAGSRDYEQLGQRVRLLLGNTSDKYRLCGTQARTLDANLTIAMNRMLHRQLSIQSNELFIQSFATDIDSLIVDALSKKAMYKPTLPALRLAEKEFIARNTFILQGDYRNCAIRNIEEIRMPEPALSDEVKNAMVLQGAPTMGVLIALNADELSIDIDVGQTRALIASEHRQLATLASTLVDMVNPITDTGSTITLTTLDCYCFELDKGLLGDHYYLVTRVR